MNRFNYIGMLAYVALSMSSCDDSFDVSSKADGVLAVSQKNLLHWQLTSSPPVVSINLLYTFRLHYKIAMY